MLFQAAEIISLMTKHMPSNIFNMIANGGHGVGVFTDPEKITVFPEFAYLKSPPECSGKVVIFIITPKYFLCFIIIFVIYLLVHANFFFS